jgi:hypothetical protein
VHCAPVRALTGFQNTVNNAPGVAQATTKVLTLTCAVLPVGILIGVRMSSSLSVTSGLRVCISKTRSA